MYYRKAKLWIIRDLILNGKSEAVPTYVRHIIVFFWMTKMKGKKGREDGKWRRRRLRVFHMIHQCFNLIFTCSQWPASVYVTRREILASVFLTVFVLCCVCRVRFIGISLVSLYVHEHTRTNVSTIRVFKAKNVEILCSRRVCTRTYQLFSVSPTFSRTHSVFELALRSKYEH